MKATAKAPANIAFIKYWGKKDSTLRLPMNSSISMNLDNVFTVTTVEFDRRYPEDEVRMVGEDLKGEEEERIIEHLNRIREEAGIDLRAKVVTQNNFPKGTGIASSASGFATLTVAACKAAGLNLSEKNLSILARLGSGSACRSIPDGYVEWKEGNSSQTSFAYSLYKPQYWDLADIIVVFSDEEKKIGSTQGHEMAESSPFFKSRVKNVQERIRKIKKSLKEKNFSSFGNILEEEALNMHAVMITSSPPLLYWLPDTLRLMLYVQRWREKGLESYFTIDAGPTVHLICQRKEIERIKRKILEIIRPKKIIVSFPTKGARLVKNHLF